MEPLTTVTDLSCESDKRRDLIRALAERFIRLDEHHTIRRLESLSDQTFYGYGYDEQDPTSRAVPHIHLPPHGWLTGHYSDENSGSLLLFLVKKIQVPFGQAGYLNRFKNLRKPVGYPHSLDFYYHASTAPGGSEDRSNSNHVLGVSDPLNQRQIEVVLNTEPYGDFLTLSERKWGSDEATLFVNLEELRNGLDGNGADGLTDEELTRAKDLLELTMFCTKLSTEKF